MKNSYDADASRVHIWLSDDGATLNVLDDGHGMSEDEFLAGWMRIATSMKSQVEYSRHLHRQLTGSKGVGRFAVRLLGYALELETVAEDGSNLRARFPWNDFKDGAQVETHPITYWTNVSSLWKDIPQGWPNGSGTLLRISNLRHDWGDDSLKSVAGWLLRLQTPSFAAITRQAKEKAGFRVYVSPPDVVQDRDDPTHEILARAAISVKVRVDDSKVTLRFKFRSGREDEVRHYKLPENLVGELTADIRFLPKRPHMFAGLRNNYDGREAPRWVRANSGVRVYDRGFQVPPYGMERNDWLRLARDAAARRRDWDTEVGRTLVPIPEKAPTEKLHPALHLPANHQVIGYVSIKTFNLSRLPGDQRDRYLQPTMDRQGFVQNEGIDQLYNLVRGALEVLAFYDLEEELRRKDEKQEQAQDRFHEQIESAIEEVTSNAEIPTPVRRSIERQLRSVQTTAARKDAAQEDTLKAVETLGLLGILAAFMTHEATAMFRDVKELREVLGSIKLDNLPKLQRDSIKTAAEVVGRAYDALENHIKYTRQFASNVRAPGGAYKARSAIREIIDQFEYFTTPRNVEVRCVAPKDLLAPAVPMSAYSGLVLNLYTNALKSVVAKKDGTPRSVLVEAEDDGDAHVLRVSDTGVGVAEALKTRIFDPLFSASDPDSALGPGMGMGLYIVKRVTDSYDGKVRLVEPVDGYSTTFELRLPHG